MTMKQILITLALVSLTACNDTPQEAVVNFEPQQEQVVEVAAIPEDAVLTMATVNIEGMTCAVGCAAMIEKNLAGTSGVKDVTVDFESKAAVITYAPELVDQTELKSVITESGVSGTYEVTAWEEDKEEFQP